MRGGWTLLDTIVEPRPPGWEGAWLLCLKEREGRGSVCRVDIGGGVALSVGEGKGGGALSVGLIQEGAWLSRYEWVRRRRGYWDPIRTQVTGSGRPTLHYPAVAGDTRTERAERNKKYVSDCSLQLFNCRFLLGTLRLSWSCVAVLFLEKPVHS